MSMRNDPKYSLESMNAVCSGWVPGGRWVEFMEKVSFEPGVKREGAMDSEGNDAEIGELAYGM